MRKQESRQFVDGRQTCAAAEPGTLEGGGRRSASDDLPGLAVLRDTHGKRAVERIERAIHYAETRQCRSQLLLAYFDEPESRRCGICDVCTGRNKSELSTDTFEAYERKIREILRKEPLPPEELMKAFALKRHEMVAKALSYLLDEKKMILNGDGLLEWNGD